jgi:hypothetical protein
LWFGLLALAIAGTAAGMHYHSIMDEQWGTPYSELGLRASNVDGNILGLPIGEETRRADVMPKSRLIAIEGRPVPEVTTRGQVAAMLRAVPGDYVRISTRRTDGSVREHRLRRSPDHLRQAAAESGISPEARHRITDILKLIGVAMLLGASILLYRSAKGDPVASLLSVGFLIIAVGSEPSRSTLLYFDMLSGVGTLSALGGFLLVLVMFIFPNGRFASIGEVVAALAYGLLVFFPASTTLIAATQWLASLGIALVAVICLGVRFSFLRPGLERQQMRWAFFGFAAAMAVGVLYLGLLVGGSLAKTEFSRTWLLIGAEIARHVALTVMLSGLMIALLRYRLYDAETVISRSTGYAVLTVLLGGTFTASTKGIEWLFESSMGAEAGAVPGAAGAGLAVVLITPLHNRIHRWAERRFQKGLLRLKRDLPEFVGDLRETASLGTLVDVVLERVAGGIRSARAAVLVGDRIVATRDVGTEEAEAWLGSASLKAGVEPIFCDRQDAMFPVRVPLCVQHEACEPLGWLLLGPRPDGSLYGKDEREALAEISDPLARAVRVVLLREEREVREEARYQRVERRFAELEEMLARLLRSKAAAG